MSFGLRLANCAWNNRLEKLVTELSPLVGVEAIKTNVESGKISAYEVFMDEHSLGFFLARGETLLNGMRQLVILHALSEVKGRTPLSSLLCVSLPRLAKDLGYQSLRIHSERRGLDAVLEEAGFKFQETVHETVFVKEVA